MTRDRYIALGLLAFTGIGAYFTSQLEGSTMEGEPGPPFFPALILMVLAILAIILFIGGRSGVTEKRSDKTESLRIAKTLSTREALSFFAVFLLGLIAIKFVGFNIGMAASLTMMLRMAGWKTKKAVLYSVFLIAAIFGIFDWLLEIPLPPFPSFGE